MKYLSFTILLFVGIKVWANDTIIVHKDSRLDVLTAKQAAANKKTNVFSRNYNGPGYRVQAISTNNREVAYHIKAQLLQYFPGHKSYMMFQSPYFKVRTGNFKDREDAEKLRNAVSRLLSINAYIVRDIVTMRLTEEQFDDLDE